MQEIHLTGIKYIELGANEELEFKYKPDVPKLKVVGNILIADNEDEDDIEGVVFLTQKQLNQVLNNKEIELKTTDENKWLTSRPLTKDQVKKIGLINLESEYLGQTGELKCFEVIKVSE